MASTAGYQLVLCLSSDEGFAEASRQTIDGDTQVTLVDVEDDSRHIYLGTVKELDKKQRT